MGRWPVIAPIGSSVALVGVAIALAGCGVASPLGIAGLLLLGLAATLATACRGSSDGSCCSHVTSPTEGCMNGDGSWEFCNYGFFDAGPPSMDSGARDAPEDAAPTITDGGPDSCDCSPGREYLCPGICNYGWDGGVDSGVAEDTWYACCPAGVVTTCYCAPATTCAYAAFVSCGDGLCRADEEPCPEGAPDGGLWAACCASGTVDTCYCDSVPCDGTAFVACADGACVDEVDGGVCP
jgi:hypothetical protein